MPSFIPCPSRHHLQTTGLADGKVDYFPVDTIIRLLRSGQSSFALDNITFSTIHQDFRRLENRASTLRLDFRSLRKQENGIYHRLQVYRSLFAPIRRLPLDVLLHIFLLLPVDTVDPNSAPWTLGSICYYWRSLYLSFPTLWSRIVVDTGACTTLRPKSVSMVHTSLKRSQRSPLSIFVSCDNQSSSIFPILFSILDLLRTDSSRWSVVEVHIPRLTYPIFNRLGPLPMLQRIRITVDHGPVAVATRDSLGRCPQLRDVCITGIQLSSLHLPLGRLISLGTIQTAEDIFRILPEAKGLEALTISYNSSFKSLSGECHSNMLTVPNIRRLQFRSGPVEQIIDRLLLPNIEYLILGCHSSPQPLSSSDIQSVTNLVRRSQCLLRSLSLNCTICLQSIEAISFNLTRLSITVESWAACDTFIALRVKGEGADVVPNLIELCITDVTTKCGGQSFTHEPFGLMVESRWNVPPRARVSQLQRIELYAKYGWGELYYSDTVHRTLWKYAEEGLDVIIFDDACTAQ
ncbi:hypothetical protein IW261DRAFT_1564479 [Armillaria novae-zelandiae]|uniref:F-box domain-containing protein n=1 Tax=Armillaria novae-zelandiae TaxID=153914 RepID=A0AA39U7E8_9AGAR|nr:hypothetical protein IW261DRAFT_1564479 [Armillaria novae-zelandiae]